MSSFQLESPFTPKGDQPEAIRQLVAGVEDGTEHQVLLGVTGSGKTFTMANVIAETQRPTLILSHNKTLAAQLSSEFKSFFPNNLVEYFVSYYDYYQPEAFIPSSNTFIEKDLQINDEIEKMRLSATSALLSGRRDVIVVASISCIYGIGNPVEFHKNVVGLEVGQKLTRNDLLHRLVTSLYSRAVSDFKRGNFRVKGDTVDVHLAYADHAVRIEFWDDEIERLSTIDPESGQVLHRFEQFNIYPANLFVSSKETTNTAVWEIQQDLEKQKSYFSELSRFLEAKRLEERTLYDLEMIKELGFCSGIENYSRYFDRRQPGERPFCLLDYFSKDFLMMIDESHVTVPQIGAMFGGDRARKVTLVDHGFRLPSAMDNRPLTHEEFKGIVGQTIYVSATPADHELEQAEGVVVEQVIRPTGLLDPPIDVRPCDNQVDDLVVEIRKTIAQQERILVTTLTKRMAEELTKYLDRLSIKTRYIHSDVKTLDRVEILRELRDGAFDVLVGVNLLREGLDLPEVSLVAIMDADKEGFLRSNRSLTQTAGRAARNVNGRVIMYADKVTASMAATMEETARRREKQMAYNEEHGLSPEQIQKEKRTLFEQSDSVSNRPKNYAAEPDQAPLHATDPIVQSMGIDDLDKLCAKTKRDMERAAKAMEFMDAARLRDELMALESRRKALTK
ncbi:MAG: excinuclease ABC subunit UvrB [Flavobacteriales bacterium]|nr:excinuclease ABC subunit UvrB [Flavobacteriales bacterium]